MVNEVGVIDNLRLENQLTELTSLVRQLVIGQYQSSAIAKVCGICTSVEHPTNMCPTLQETKSDHLESVGAIGGYQYRNTTIPTTTTTDSVITRQLTIYGGPDEVVRNEQPRSAGSGNLPSQTILNPRGNTSVVSLRSGKELPQVVPQQRPRPIVAESELDADSQVPQQDRSIPLSFPTQTILARKP
ncbi:hypothetical protein CR513_15961, partial [Mucuna pruriens]